MSEKGWFIMQDNTGGIKPVAVKVTALAEMLVKGSCLQFFLEDVTYSKSDV